MATFRLAIAQSIYDEPAIKRLQQILNHYVEERKFAGSIAIKDKQQLVLLEGFGYAHKEKEVPFKSSTAFSIGTLSQHFNAVATMLLVEAGELNLDDPITKFFQDVPKDKRTIKISQLLAHTSGLPDFFANRSDHFKVSRNEAVKSILNLRLNSKPGRKFSVSNAGYSLLAAIIEEVTQKAYADFIRLELFDRAGLQHTGFHGENMWPVHEVAKGYGFNERNRNIPTEWPKPSWMIIGTSDIISTAEDLQLWWDALLDTRIVSEETLELMMQQHSLDKTRRFIYYGYGMKHKENEHGSLWYYNGGGEYGQICSMRYYPESDIKIILLSNTYLSLNPTASVVIRQVEKALFEPESFFLRELTGE